MYETTILMKKEKLEEERLKLEIQDLKRHWLKKPQYLQVLLPTTLAIFSLLYAITSGLFSAKQELLELNKKLLEADILAFQKEKKQLIITNDSLKSQIGKYNDSLQNRNLILKKYEKTFVKEQEKIQTLNYELVILKNTKDDYNSKIATLEAEYNSKKQIYLKEIESKYYKEIDNEKRDKELQESVKNLKEQILDLNHKINLLETNPYIKQDKKFEFNNWISTKMIEYYESKSVKNQKEIEQLEKSLYKHKKTLDTIKVKGKIKRIK
ncbi:MAG: hypothetical protein K0S33_3101 [Bacteroidetes bacterium]|nr:hypothetical protein [Bacteroidota bacterium]